jgi:hypothetical protein
MSMTRPARAKLPNRLVHAAPHCQLLWRHMLDGSTTEHRKHQYHADTGYERRRLRKKTPGQPTICTTTEPIGGPATTASAPTVVQLPTILTIQWFSVKSLTERGQSLFEVVVPQQEVLIAKLLAPLSEDEQRELLRLLRKLDHAIPT